MTSDLKWAKAGLAVCQQLEKERARLQTIIDDTKKLVTAGLLHVNSVREAERLGAPEHNFSSESIKNLLTEIQESLNKIRT